MFNHSVNTFVSLAISWAVLGLGAYLVVEGELNGLFLAMLVMISLTVFENAAPMAVFPNHLEDSRRAATRLYSVVRNEGIQEGCPVVQLPEEGALSLEMEKVSFSFPEEFRAALDEVSFNLPAGSKTAIVGPSGSGKSTLIQLLLKIHPADSGMIHVSGTPIIDITQKSLWKKANVVLQENHFFYGTIRENLLLAGDDLSDAYMLEALAKVRLERFSLEDAVLEKGENLSGGEKQRLAIARAMLKGGRLWLLDEPTSSVDALTEQVVFNHLLKQAENDTLVLVSHRLTGLEKMDQILVMEQGRVVEAGTFKELMERQGYFYEMKQIEKSVFM
jgi:ATP-binding cassette subfamily C protein CydC